MDINHIATNLVALQIQLNNKFFSQYNTVGDVLQNTWPRSSMIVELVEMIEHIGWEYWKKPEFKVKVEDIFKINSGDIDHNNPTQRKIMQARMELIDVLHFYISDLQKRVISHNLTSNNDTPWSQYEEKLEYDSVVDVIENFLTHLNEPDYDEYLKASKSSPVFCEEDFYNMVRLMSSYTINRSEFNIQLAKLFSSLGMSVDLVERLYVGKNGLNHFRRSMGEGKVGCSYQRIWVSGKEDNEHLSELIYDKKVVDFNTPEKVSIRLKEVYEEIHS